MKTTKKSDVRDAKKPLTLARETIANLHVRSDVRTGELRYTAVTQCGPKTIAQACNTGVACTQ
jgi:hypothetical protein